MSGDVILLRQSDAFYAELNALRLTAPAIQVTGVLHARMQRHGRQLEIDETALADGIKAIEPEQPIVIRFDSQSKDEYGVDPTAIFDEGDSWYSSDEPTVAQIRIKPNFTKDDVRENGANRKLSEAFWLGLVVCDSLAEGKGGDLRSEMASRAKRQSKKEYIPPVLAGFSVLETVRNVSHLGFATALVMGVSTELAVAAAMAIKRGHERPNFDDFLASKFGDRAASLASQHRVLRQGFTDV